MVYCHYARSKAIRDKLYSGRRVERSFGDSYCFYYSGHWISAYQQHQILIVLFDFF